MILISSPSKPFTYTGKGTPRRPAIIDAYAPEIEALYATVDKTTQSTTTPPDSWTAEKSLRYVREIVKKVMARLVGDEQDIFQYGCDRQVLWLIFGRLD